MRNFFTYNGVSSESLGIRIQSKNVYSAPKYDVTLTSIPGRNGDLVSPNGRFGNGSLSYTCFVPARTIAELEEKLTKIKNWLYGEAGEYHPLTDTYDEKHLRYALFNNKLDISDEARRIGTFTVTFSVKPFRYLLSGLEKQTFTADFTLTNPYAFTAKPYLKIIGTGSGSFTVQSEGNNKIWQFLEVDGYIECDSELMNFYKDTVLKNSVVTGDGFPELRKGVNSISFDGDITGIEIIPRWVSL